MGRRTGIARDRQVRDVLASQDWFAVCARGSHGCADIIAIRVGSIPRVIQVKSTAAGPYHSFGPSERRELSYAAELGGAQAWLAWWPPRGKLRWIPEAEWPR
jgi:hypothetical protein